MSASTKSKQEKFSLRKSQKKDADTQMSQEPWQPPTVWLFPQIPKVDLGKQIKIIALL